MCGSLTHAFGKNLLRIYYVLDSVPGTRYTMIKGSSQPSGKDRHTPNDYIYKPMIAKEEQISLEHEAKRGGEVSLKK